MNLSDETKIQPFYSELRRRLQPQNIPLTEWNSIRPGTPILALQSDLCQNFDSASIVISRAIYNLLDSNKETLITDGYFQGELRTYSAACDGLGYLQYIVEQAHPNFRHEVAQPSIAASLKPPVFSDNDTLFEFCEAVHVYMNTTAPTHFTPLAAAQFVAESLRNDTRFNKGRAYLEEVIMKNNNGSGYVPPKLAVKHLPRLILQCYDNEMKRELAKPRRSGATRFNASRVDVGFDPSRADVCFDTTDSLVMHRMNTRSSTKDKSSRFERKRDSDGSENEKDIPLIQCGACGAPGHETKDCRKKGPFLRLNEWFQKLSPAQRKLISRELDRNAQETHERYKKAYKNRKDVRKRVNKAELASEDRLLLLRACTAQIPDLDFGTLDPNMIDDNEPELEFNPDTDRLLD
jgi:hypothetical protein